MRRKIKSSRVRRGETTAARRAAARSRAPLTRGPAADDDDMAVYVPLGAGVAADRAQGQAGDASTLLVDGKHVTLMAGRLWVRLGDKH